MVKEVEVELAPPCQIVRADLPYHLDHLAVALDSAGGKCI